MGFVGHPVVLGQLVPVAGSADWLGQAAVVAVVEVRERFPDGSNHACAGIVVR